MKILIRLLPALTCLLFVAACGSGEDAKSPLTALDPGMQTVSYALGMEMATQVDRMPGASDHATLEKGLQDHIAGNAKIDVDACREIMQAASMPAGPDVEVEFDAANFASADEQNSYAAGVTIAEVTQRQFDGIDGQALCQGLHDKLAGGETLLPDDDVREVVSEFQRQQQEMKSAANTAEGEKFLAENAQRAGVTVTESGLQYEVLHDGDGAHPAATDKVKVHYAGTLINGTEFDSSIKRGEPIEFPLNRVIAGWTEGVQLMPVGSKYKFFIPSELAYGPRGAGPDIGPHATLIFEVELLDIVE